MVVKHRAQNERIVVTHRVVACIGCLLKLLWKEYSYTWKKFVEGPMHARQDLKSNSSDTLLEFVRQLDCMKGDYLGCIPQSSTAGGNTVMLVGNGTLHVP
ncbi:hypothetical protein QL285_027041 [Trifolium repens]|nr:hypothetical protein QL285_027041 [Trifolium repens]